MSFGEEEQVEEVWEEFGCADVLCALLVVAVGLLVIRLEVLWLGS